MNEITSIYSEKKARPIWKIIEDLINKSKIIKMEIEHEMIEIHWDGTSPIPDHLYSGILDIKIRIKPCVEEKK